MILSLLISSLRIKKKVLALENACGQNLLLLCFFLLWHGKPTWVIAAYFEKRRAFFRFPDGRSGKRKSCWKSRMRPQCR